MPKAKAPAVDLIFKPLKYVPVFRPKRLKNHTLWRGTYLYTLYRGDPFRVEAMVDRLLAKSRPVHQNGGQSLRLLS